MTSDRFTSVSAAMRTVSLLSFTGFGERGLTSSFKHVARILLAEVLKYFTGESANDSR